MAIRIKRTGGSLTRKVHRTADMNDPQAIKALLVGSNPDDVVIDDQGNQRLRTSVVPIEQRIELQRDECAAYLAATHGDPVEHPSATWYASEVHWRLDRALRGADDETKIRLWLVMEAGRLLKEASLAVPEIRLDQDDARREAARKGLHAHNEAATQSNLERDAILVAKAMAIADRFPSYRPYRIAGELYRAAGLSRKQVDRIIRPHLTNDGHSPRRVQKK